jgi:predicted Zn finger-like uncharacterized protein
MSLITRCPDCKTMFRVVPDQLRISEGWVRCGQCESVFDASLNLQDKPASPVETRDFRVDVPPYSSLHSGELAPDLQDTNLQPRQAESLPVSKFLTQTPTEPDRQDWTRVYDEQVQSAAQVTIESAESAAGIDPDEIRPTPPPSTDKGLPERFSFIREPQAKASAWNSTGVRASLMTLTLLLVCTLLLQLVLHERNRIAAIQPVLQPALQSLCGFLGCKVTPLRQIESISIESSSLNKIKGDVYRLNLTLKNTSEIDLAAPSIELSLTDLQDQPLLRRVFHPSELVDMPPVLSAGSDISASLPLGIKPTGELDRIAGYRVLAFYP